MMKVLLRDERMRPVLQTPPKGSVGDRCIESEVGETDIPTILRKYAGNLAELMAWRGDLKYGVQPPNNAEDAFRALENVKSLYENSGSKLSFEDWVRDSLLFKSTVSDHSDASTNEVTKNETNESEEIHE